MNRRDVLKGAALLTAAPMFVPSAVFGANERIRVGMIGTGKMGQGHCRTLGNFKEALIVAIADVDTMSREEAAGHVRKAHENRGKPTDIDLYSDFRKLIARDDIDAVVVATPDHWHAIAAIEACKAGKDVYCEKPLSLTVEEAWQMVAAARKHDRVFQTGSQQRSSKEFRRAANLIRNGYIGELKTVHVSVGGPSKWCDLPDEETPEGLDWNMWLGQAPERAYNKVLRPPHNKSFPRWRSYREYSGGGMTDWGAHHFDIAQWALDKDGSGPVEVHAKDDKDFETLTYVYDNGVRMFHGKTKDVGKYKGILFTGTEGTVEVTRGHLKCSNELFQDYRKFEFKDTDKLVYKSQNHHMDWLQAIKDRTRPICDVEVGASSVSVCHLGNISYWTKSSFKYDPVKHTITDNDEAKALLRRDKRAPWDGVTV